MDTEIQNFYWKGKFLYDLWYFYVKSILLKKKWHRWKKKHEFLHFCKFYGFDKTKRVVEI